MIMQTIEVTRLRELAELAPGLFLAVAPGGQHVLWALPAEPLTVREIGVAAPPMAVLPVTALQAGYLLARAQGEMRGRFGLEADAFDALAASDLRRFGVAAAAVRAATAARIEAMRAELRALKALMGGGRP